MSCLVLAPIARQNGSWLPLLGWTAARYGGNHGLGLVRELGNIKDYCVSFVAKKKVVDDDDTRSA
jgi:hypothetical protein